MGTKQMSRTDQGHVHPVNTLVSMRKDLRNIMRIFGFCTTDKCLFIFLHPLMYLCTGLVCLQVVF